VRELRLNTSEITPTLASSVPIVVVPKTVFKKGDGLGSLLQHYRRSLAYALALGLPWAGSLVNTHDHIDYAEYLGLCQPFCTSEFEDFDSIDVNVTKEDMDECETNRTFKVPQGLKRPTLIRIDDGAVDEGHAVCLAGLRERFVSTAMRSVACTRNYYEVFHFRWGDVKTNDCDRPDSRGVNMSEAVELIKSVRQLCPLEVKVMSEGADVKECFAERFSYRFEYVDGAQSNVPYDLLTFACSTVLVAGTSSFSVLGALLTDGLVIAPISAYKLKSLHNSLYMSSTSQSTLATALRRLPPCA